MQLLKNVASISLAAEKCFVIKKVSFRNRQAWKIDYREHLASAESFQ